jgi:hypothetical protein
MIMLCINARPMNLDTRAVPAAQIAGSTLYHHWWLWLEAIR